MLDKRSTMPIKTALNWISLTQSTKSGAPEQTNKRHRAAYQRPWNSTEEWKEITWCVSCSQVEMPSIMKMSTFHMQIYRFNSIQIKSHREFDTLTVEVVFKSRGSRRKRTQWLRVVPYTKYQNCLGPQWWRQRRIGARGSTRQGGHDRPEHAEQKQCYREQARDPVVYMGKILKSHFPFHVAIHFSL